MAKLRIFISWSGDGSGEVAKVLRDWFPKMLQNVDPFLSTEDISKGTFWQAKMVGELSANVGIICLTNQNKLEPWIHFEVGAISKALAQNRVVPLLIDLTPSDVGLPLSMFQMTQLRIKEDFKRLAFAINKILDETKDGLSEAHFSETFEQWWPALEKQVDSIVSEFPDAPEDQLPDKQEAMLAEILENSRSIVRSIAGKGFESLLGNVDPKPQPENIIKRSEIEAEIESPDSGGAKRESKKKSSRSRNRERN